MSYSDSLIIAIHTHSSFANVLLMYGTA